MAKNNDLWLYLGVAAIVLFVVYSTSITPADSTAVVGS